MTTQDKTTEYLTHDLNSGYSWGLQYPIIYGWRPEHNAWVVWNRHTGEITHKFYPEDDKLADYEACKASEPRGYNDEFIDFDGVP